MKINKFLAVALAATTMFASCSKNSENENPNIEGKMTTVRLNIEAGEIDSRVQAPGASEGLIKFTDGMIYFTDATGIILKSIEVGTGLDQINLSSPGVRSIDEVPSSSSKVYIVGNINEASYSYPTTGNINQVTAKVMDMASQIDLTGTKTDVTKVTLYGADLAMDTTDPDEYEAEVNVNPIGSRFEISQFSLKTGSTITAYKVDGIFMNNIHLKSQVSGIKTIAADNDLLSAGTESNPQVPTVYVENSGKYPTGDKGYSYEYNASGLGTLASGVYKPATSGNVWAFNVFAPTGADKPHIIIRLSGFLPALGFPNTYYYMTVDNFVKSDGSAATFEPGKIYTITDFEFDENDLDVAPYEGSVTAKVDVKLATWTKEPIKPW